MSAALSAARRAMAQAVPGAARSIQSSAFRAGDHGHGPAYLHAKQMYDVGGIPNRSAVVGGSCLTILAVGFGGPILAVQFSINKSR